MCTVAAAVGLVGAVASAGVQRKGQLEENKAAREQRTALASQITPAELQQVDPLQGNQQQRRTGLAPTVSTSPLGLTNTASTRKKTLLGQ